MKVHPVAELFPMMSEEEIADLAADIKQNGLVHAIVMDVIDGEETLIDGRNRLKACELAGVEPHFAKLNGYDPVAFILSNNIARRHLNAGQRAIVVAKVYPEVHQGKKTSSKLEEVKGAALSRARSVLRYAPELADQVLFQGLALNEAYEKARARKAEAETNEDKMARLRKDAPDLADLAGMSLDEAITKLDHRKAEEAQLKTIEKDAPDLVALVREGRMSVSDAMGAFTRREEEKHAAQTGATSLLAQVVHLIGIEAVAPKIRAANLMENVNPEMWPQGRLSEFSSEYLKACGEMLIECSKILRSSER